MIISFINKNLLDNPEKKLYNYLVILHTIAQKCVADNLEKSQFFTHSMQ